MLNPNEIETEQQRLHKLTQSALSLVTEVCTSDYWSYTREYDLYKLNVAKDILTNTLKEILT